MPCAAEADAEGEPEPEADAEEVRAALPVGTGRPVGMPPAPGCNGTTIMLSRVGLVVESM